MSTLWNPLLSTASPKAEPRDASSAHAGADNQPAIAAGFPNCLRLPDEVDARRAHLLVDHKVNLSLEGTVEVLAVAAEEDLVTREDELPDARKDLVVNAIDCFQRLVDCLKLLPAILGVKALVVLLVVKRRDKPQPAVVLVSQLLAEAIERCL